MRSLERTADPWTDTDVIDARAPRTNQAIVGALSLVAFVTGWWPILGLLAAQLAIGLRFGRRWCLPCLLYFDVIQPRFGEGPIEDSRPPRFANMVGVAFLTSATLAHAMGFTVDVSRRPELARKYGVALVPTAVAVGPGGIVTARLA